MDQSHLGPRDRVEPSLGNNLPKILSSTLLYYTCAPDLVPERLHSNCLRRSLRALSMRIVSSQLPVETGI